MKEVEAAPGSREDTVDLQWEPPTAGQLASCETHGTLNSRAANSVIAPGSLSPCLEVSCSTSKKGSHDFGEDVRPCLETLQGPRVLSRGPPP